VSGMKMPPAVLFSCSTPRIKTRSCRGRNFIEGLLVLEFDGAAHPSGSALAGGGSRYIHARFRAHVANTATRANLPKWPLRKSFDRSSWSGTLVRDLPGRSCHVWP
jgi:hypothetical protein